MSFLRRLVPVLPGGDDDSDGGEGEALLEHEDYSSSESESSSSHDEARLNEGESESKLRCKIQLWWYSPDILQSSLTPVNNALCSKPCFPFQ